MVHVHRRDGPSVIIRVEDDLDMASSPALGAALRLVALNSAPDQRVIVSLEACRFCDASGLNVLVKAKKSLGERLSVVVPAQSSARKIFQIAHLERELSVRESLQEAVDAAAG